MQLCRYKTSADTLVFGALGPDGIVPLHDVSPSLPSEFAALVANLSKLENALVVAEKVKPSVNISRLVAPLPTPEKIICIGLNYRDHARETGAAIPIEPVVFSKFSSAISGPYDPIVLPAASTEVDYEAELVVVIGKSVHRVSAVEAMDCVAGYCCGHDVSARDWQKGKPGGQWLLGKSFDSFAPIGPGLTLRSQIADPGKLAIRMVINGQTLQDSTTADLIFNIPELIQYVSQVATLRPGDLIFTGTPAGVGAARTPPRFLQPGDVCRVEIEGLGAIENRCVAEV